MAGPWDNQDDKGAAQAAPKVVKRALSLTFLHDIGTHGCVIWFVWAHVLPFAVTLPLLPQLLLLTVATVGGLMSVGYILMAVAMIMFMPNLRRTQIGF